MGLELHPRLEARSRGGPVENGPQSAARRQAHERLVAHLGQVPDRCSAGRQHQDDLLVHQVPGREPGRQVVVDRPEHQIDLARVQQRQQPGDQPGAQGQRDARITGVEAGERGRQVIAAEHGHGAECHPPVQHGRELREVRTGAVQLAEYPPATGQQQLACLGERHPAGGPGEQGSAQLGLQRPDLRRHRGLGHP